MAGKGLIAFIVLCFASASLAANVEAEEARGVVPEPSNTKADQRLFVSDGTQITVSTETLALGVLLLGLVALALVILPGLLGGGDSGTAVAYETAPSTYAADPYASRSARSSSFASLVLSNLNKAAQKYL